MKIIGITGGVGCGKTTVLDLINEYCQGKCKILLADNIANELKLYGQPLYEPIVELLGKDVVNNEGEKPQIDKNKMAAMIFDPTNKQLLKAINDLIHPAVKKYILDEIASCKKSMEYDYFFLEAALLLEEKYDEILDEVWYIYSSVSTRRERLKLGRGYTDEKIDNIMSKQLSEEEFRSRCSHIIDNDGSREQTLESVKKVFAKQ